MSHIPEKPISFAELIDVRAADEKKRYADLCSFVNTYLVNGGHNIPLRADQVPLKEKLIKDYTALGWHITELPPLSVYEIALTFKQKEEQCQLTT